MLEGKDYHQKTKALNRIYERLLIRMESQNICKSYPRKYRRSSSGVRFDIQSSAKDVHSTIRGELKDIAINDITLGAIDQWMFNEDVILSAEHMKSLMSVYKTELLETGKGTQLNGSQYTSILYKSEYGRNASLSKTYSYTALRCYILPFPILFNIRNV